MPRKALVALSLLFAVGFVVAIVQAQETSRYSPAGIGVHPGPPAEPGRLPAGVSPSTSGSLAARLRATTESVTSEYGQPDAAQAAHNSTIKSSQYRSTRPNPTYPKGPPVSQPAPRAYQPPPSFPPPVIAPAAPAALQPAPQALLGTPSVTPPTMSVEVSDVGDVETDATVTPAGGMRSVLKRGRGAIVNEVRPPAFSPQPEPAATTAPEVSAVPAPTTVEAAEDAPAGLSARRTPADSTVSTPSIPSARRPVGNPGSETARSIQELSLTGRSAALRVAVAGPQSISVGKSATYVVNLFNDGEVDANQVQLKASIPAWVSVNSGETTAGDAAVRGDGKGASNLVWSVPKVPAKSHQTLRLQVTASEGHPFELALEWSMQATSAKATISVQQPQLELAIAGAADMLFGQEKIFTVTVSNPGNGDAEGVMVSIASGAARPQQIDVGLVPAGMQKEIPVQVVANQAGEMGMQAVAVGQGNLRAEATGKVLVRRAALAVAVEGPQLKYSGTDAMYLVSISNNGDAPADELTVSVALPSGANYLGGVEGAAATPAAVKWKVAGIPAGAERTFEMKLQLNGMGMNRVVVQAHNEAGIAVSGQAETQVEAISDLKLTVNDPAGPIAVGTDATYELTLTNRGTKSAGEVRVVMQFSEGVEPLGVEGAQANVVPGQIVCEPLPQLAAGEKVTFRVKAQADRGGTHQFRVEVTTNDQETRLVTEGTTRFFADSARSNPVSRTARRPSLLPPTAVPGTLQR